MAIGILTNPRSRKNQNRPDAVRRLMALAGDDVLVRATAHLDEVRDAVRDFIDAGCGTWIADGGDGTLHWLMNEGGAVLRERGLWDGEGPFPVPMCPTNGGTIDFVARKTGIRGRADRLIQALLADQRAGRPPATIELPTLRVTGRHAGVAAETPDFCRLGFATAIGGIGQKFFHQYYQAPKPSRWTILQVAARGGLGHMATFVPVRGVRWLETLQGHGRHILEGTRARVAIDGQELPYDLYQGLHAGSIDLDFVTMKLFPYAGLPGRLHLVAGAMSRSECSWKWMFLVAGRPVPGGTWHEVPGTAMDVQAPPGEVLDPVIDGEFFRGLEELHVRPGPTVPIAVPARRLLLGPGD
jgi:hypothetical protein